MTSKIISALIIFAGLINFAPIIGILSADRLQGLYGLNFEEGNLLILMRHRALLFGLLGAFMIYAAFRPSLQPLALVAGFVAMLGFIGLAWQVGGYNASIGKIMIVDVVGSIALTVAGVLYWLKD